MHWHPVQGGEEIRLLAREFTISQYFQKLNCQVLIKTFPVSIFLNVKLLFLCKK